MSADGEAGMSRRTRLALVIAFWGVLLGGALAFLAVSDRQVSSGLASVEAKASGLTVSNNDIFAAMFSADAAEAIRVASGLGVDPTDLDIATPGENGPYCLTVHVRRLGRERRVTFRVEGNGRLQKVGSCA